MRTLILEISLRPSSHLRSPSNLAEGPNIRTPPRTRSLLHDHVWEGSTAYGLGFTSTPPPPKFPLLVSLWSLMWVFREQYRLVGGCWQYAGFRAFGV